MARQRCTVEYQVGYYSGRVTVFADSNDENVTIQARAKAQLRRRHGPLIFGVESFRVVERVDA